jgi:L-threonylcarbamoyladenylate synthase
MFYIYNSPTVMKDFVSIEQAIKILNAEGVVAVPTETVYGLAARIDSELALNLIFKTKDRPFFDPLIVHVSDLEMIYDYVIKPHEVLIKLAQKFWPGPLTIVFNKNSLKISDLITSGLPTVAIRWPNHKLTESLIQKMNIPIAAPSANPFKKTSPTSAQHVQDYFPDLAILDGGSCDFGLESTIVKLNSTANGISVLEILRPGGISKKELEVFLAEESMNISVVENFDAEGPGSMEEHYQPMAPLYLFLNKKADLSLAEFKNKKVQILNLPSDPRTCARLLYKTLIDESKNADILVLEWNYKSEDPNWSAIYNRIKKAAKVINT